MDIQYVTLCQIDELTCIRIQHPNASALIALQGAQLLEYTPTGEKPVIWLSEQAEFKKGQSIRGGIPICWPWFGDARRNPDSVQQHLPTGKLPAHGWVRDKPWLLDFIYSDSEKVTLRLQFPTSVWPDPFPDGVELSLEMEIGKQLRLNLKTFNGSNETLNFSQALHSYFTISDVEHILIKNLEGVTFIDTLDDWKEKTEDSAVRITGETDRIYVDTPELISIRDEKWGRSVQIESDTAKSAVVWNPWIEKGKRLSQFGEDSYREMVCVETGYAASHNVQLAKYADFISTMSINYAGCLL